MVILGEWVFLLSEVPLYLTTKEAGYPAQVQYPWGALHHTHRVQGGLM